MKNGIFSFIAVLLTFAVVLTVFTACKGTGDDDSSTAGVFKDDGKVFFRPSDGEEARVLATNDNGVTKVDDDGNMIFEMTDVDGSLITELLSFPEIIVSGDIVECQQFSLELPNGWEQKVQTAMMIYDTKTLAQIDYTFYEGTDDEPQTVEQRIGFFTDLVNQLNEAGMHASINTEKVKVAGREATVLTVKHDEAYQRAYLFVDGNDVLCFLCGCSDLKVSEEYDFVKVLDKLEFRY